MDGIAHAFTLRARVVDPAEPRVVADGPVRQQVHALQAEEGDQLPQRDVLLVRLVVQVQTHLGAPPAAPPPVSTSSVQLTTVHSLGEAPRGAERLGAELCAAPDCVCATNKPSAGASRIDKCGFSSFSPRGLGTLGRGSGRC